MTEVEKIVARGRRARVLFGVAIGAVCFVAVAGLVGAIVANVVNTRQDTKITKVERQSACEGDATSAECQTIKREGDEARSIADTCIAFWKVGYPCPKPGTKAAQRVVEVRSGGGSKSPSSGSKGTDDAVSVNGPSVPNQSPAGGGTGQSPGVGDSTGQEEGHPEGHDPAPKSSQPSPVAESEGHSDGQEPAAPVIPTPPGQTIREAVQSTLDDTGVAVKETGKEVSETVGGLLCGVQERLLGSCRP